MNDNMGIGFTMYYSSMLDETLEDAAELTYGDSDVLFGGISASYSF